MIYLIAFGAFVIGLAVGFIMVAVRINQKPSGILHIKETEEKDYYTIEITDDLGDISKKKAIMLLIKTSRDMHSL